MKLNEIVQRCVTIEQMLAELYRSFATRFSEPAVHRFWSELADEEVSHGIALGEVVRLPAAERDDGAIDARKIEAMHTLVEGCFGLAEPSLDQALDLALDLEDMELDNIYRRLHAITVDDRRMSHAFRTAMGAIGKHEQRILDMIEQCASDPQLRAKAAARRERMLRTGH